MIFKYVPACARAKLTKLEEQRVFQWYEMSAHVLARIFQVIPEIFHLHGRIFQWREVSVHVHEVSVHVREASVHVREVSVHVREVSVHVHEASVHVPKNLMQREKTVIFPVSIPFYEDVPIIGIKQFKLYKST